ncbi:uncharacterized protein BDR25DRAFT_343088 [Lindgomyces ingoldianus]|uniref:Uncharacterized protein n=1 Tax=Lindgomyces ingoldianus TaxID=673940 RepID=A0ACB6QTG5_9PLEO|nr:uncharacterized protein BDR25DRAFT_343088 [Lindgomyces ingoldianus]KAF2470314.1 hypothetical protein BDR25DRAFT_343088 [Lindgomyces ingoldianus]
MDPSSYEVHRGLWTNWSHGRVSGLTITTTRQNGGLLIAFLAIFVGAAGKSFWRISCLLLHRVFSSQRAQDGLYHQRQAILRNSDTAQDGFWRTLMAIIAWRKHNARSLQRLLPMLVFAVATGICFAVAGIFSSRVTTETANEVLLTGTNCALMGFSGLSNITAFGTVWEPYNSQRVTASLARAQQCYNTGTFSEDCGLYIKPQLSVNITRNASCPFASEICRTQTENIIVDTGYMDSHEDFGINAPLAERFKFRSVYHCAPIVTEGFSELYNSTNIPGMTFRRYNYGGFAGSNYTFEVPTNLSTLQYDNYTFWQSSRPDYGVGLQVKYSVTNEGNALSGQLDSIPQIQRDNADVSLFFLTAPGILFSSQSNDPWYSAHRPGPNLTNPGSHDQAPSYMMDEDATVLGCARQFTICNPNMPEAKRCLPLRGWLDNSYRLEEITQNEAQKNRLHYLREVMIGNNDEIISIVGSTGNAGLLARDNLGWGVQGPLPDNQWQLEIQHWVTATMASLQRIFVDAARGPPNEDMRKWFSVRPNTTEELKMCRNQKVVSSRYSSFSVVGIVAILVIGGGFVFLDWFSEAFIDSIHKRFGRTGHSDYASIEWNASATLQIQRLAHEEMGFGKWSRTDTDTPVTRPGEKLGVLDVADPKHPFLKPPPRGRNGTLGRKDTDMTMVSTEEHGGERKGPITVCVKDRRNSMEI